MLPGIPIVFEAPRHSLLPESRTLSASAQHRALGFGKAQQPVKAIVSVHRCPVALVLNPNSAASWTASGWVHMYLGESARAIGHFERAMRLSPLDPLTYFAATGMAFAHAFARRYDEAKSWATKALHEQPNWATPLRAAAIANALSDRMVEARAAMACLRQVDPALRLSNVGRVAPPFRRAEDRVRFLESLRKAGLPE